jgi:hypothetical protein
MSEPTVTVTRYEVSLLPESNVNRHHYTITVEHRGDGRWAVLDSRWCLGKDGEWDFEVLPSERTDEWLAEHRFDLDTALAMAKRQAPLIVVNGITVQQALERGAA